LPLVGEEDELEFGSSGLPLVGEEAALEFGSSIVDDDELEPDETSDSAPPSIPTSRTRAFAPITFATFAPIERANVHRAISDSSDALVRETRRSDSNG
jgi:hypothetical protein